MPVSHEKKLVFVHIPKNAGTAITASADHNFVDEGHHPIRYYRKRYPELGGQYESFAVVRNPWDRCVSCYEYARMERSYWHSSDGTTRYPAHPDLSTLSGVDFEECIAMLLRQPSLLKHRGWLPQYVWLGDWWRRVRVDRVFRYEGLESDPCFRSMFPRLARVNCSRRTQGDYRNYYNARTRDAVYRIYRKDIKLFGFDF